VGNTQIFQIEGGSQEMVAELHFIWKAIGIIVAGL